MTNRKQLAAFREQLSAQTGRAVPRLADWAAAFRELDASLDVPGRKVVLLDEVSWMWWRNFENGILTDDPALVAPLVEQFDSVWRGDFCHDCGRREFCGDCPIA